MVKVKTLIPPQTCNIMIFPNKHLSRIRTLKLHVKLCNNHHRGGVTTLQYLRLMIPLPKLFHQTKLVIREAANTLYALILILISQKYMDIVVYKVLFQPFSCAIRILYFYSFRTHIIQLFLCSILGANPMNTQYRLQQQYINKQIITKQFYSKLTTTLHKKSYVSIAIYQSTNRSHHYEALFQEQHVAAVQEDDVVRVTSQIQKQAHSRTKKTRHHSQPLRLYTISPIHFELSRIREQQLTAEDY